VNALTRILSAWNAFWFAPASPYPLAAFRILLGAYLVGYFGSFAPHAALLFSSEGVYVPYLVPDYAPPPAIAVPLFAALWLASLALLLGFRTGLTIPILLVLYLYHYFLALGVKHSSFERLIVIYLLALAPNHADAVWSVSQPPAAQPAATVQFAGRLVRFQTVMLYLGAGLWKAVNPAWATGALLYSTLQGIWATPLAFSIVRLGFSEATWTLASHCVVASELLLGVLLIFKRTRTFGVLLGCAFHLSNSVILSIPEFLVCLAPYPLFLPERYLIRLDCRLRALLTAARRLRAVRRQPGS
jgi:hypothetical protein